MKQQLFVALGMLNPDPAATVLENTDYDEDDRTLIGLSSNLAFYGDNRYALLDAWASHPDWLRGLEAHLLEISRQPANQEQAMYGLSHAAELLREAYRRNHSLDERATLCREIGPQQGWPYADLISAYQEQGQWARVLEWADDGLSKLPAQSFYRLALEEARGAALLRLDRPAEALAALQSLFKRKRDVSIYLTLRAAAQATGAWPQLYPQLTAEAEQQVLAEVANRSSGFTSGSLMVAVLLGYAHLLEGEIERAVAWGLNPAIPRGWQESDLLTAVAGGLLRMGLAAAHAKPDDILRAALDDAPPIIREQGEALDTTALSLLPNALLDGAVRLYERLITRAVDGRKRESYAIAAGYAKVIHAIRKLQGRTHDFQAYYQSLFDTYPRLPALKDELRSAIEGPGYKRKR
jgi:tetratricopeptide (TPR) repeat protein